MQRLKRFLSSKRTWGILLYGVAASFEAAGVGEVAKHLEQIAAALMAIGVAHAAAKSVGS